MSDFSKNGVANVTDSTFAYTGFQNALHTMGISIDEEVDATGLSWVPSAKGPTVERYVINTAATPGRRVDCR